MTHVIRTRNPHEANSVIVLHVIISLWLTHLLLGVSPGMSWLARRRLLLPVPGLRLCSVSSVIRRTSCRVSGMASCMSCQELAALSRCAASPAASVSRIRASSWSLCAVSCLCLRVRWAISSLPPREKASILRVRAARSSWDSVLPSMIQFPASREHSIASLPVRRFHACISECLRAVVEIQQLILRLLTVGHCQQCRSSAIGDGLAVLDHGFYAGAILLRLSGALDGLHRHERNAKTVDRQQYDIKAACRLVAGLQQGDPLLALLFGGSGTGRCDFHTISLFDWR